MNERKIHKPTALMDSPDSRFGARRKVEILEEDLAGTAVVKKILLRKLPLEGLQPGQEMRAGEFYIKEVPDSKEIPPRFPPYNRPGFVDNPEPELLTPMAILAAQKKWYDFFRQRYDRELPGFVIKKIFALMEDETGKQHGYVIKPHVDSHENDVIRAMRIDLGEFLQKLKTGVDVDKESCLDFIARLKKHYLDSLEKQKTFQGALKKFTAITKKLLQEEGFMLDINITNTGSNLLITPEGYLRLIDTDTVQKLTNKQGGKLASYYAWVIVLDGLEYVADHFLD